MSKLQIRYRDPASLKLDPRNARTHSEKQLAEIAASISEFGFTNPVLIDEHDTLIAGEGRLRAALQLKLGEVPTILLRGLTVHQRRAYALADNRIALNSGWNEKLLALELEELHGFGLDLGTLGFAPPEIESLLSSRMIDRDSGATDPKKEWAESNMPEYEQANLAPHHTLRIHFQDDAAIARFCELLNPVLVAQVLKVDSRWVWFPERPPEESTADIRYVSSVPDLHPEQEPARLAADG